MKLWGSTVRITHGDFVLTDFSDLLEAEPEPVRTLVPQIVMRPRAASVRVYARGNAQHALSWTVWREHSSPAAARTAALDHLVAIPQTTGILTLSSLGGGSHVLIDALIQETPVRYEKPHYSVTTYSVIGGSLHALPNAVTIMVFSDGSPMVFSNGDLMIFSNPPE